MLLKTLARERYRKNSAIIIQYTALYGVGVSDWFTLDVRSTIETLFGGFLNVHELPNYVILM